MFILTMQDDFSDRSAEMDKKRLAKPFYSKTVLQIVFAEKRLAKPFYDSTDYAGGHQPIRILKNIIYFLFCQQLQIDIRDKN